MGVDAFATSDEAFAAQALLEAYRTGNVEEVKKCIESHHMFLELDNQVPANTLCQWCYIVKFSLYAM
jgi:hypothetical protein